MSAESVLEMLRWDIIAEIMIKQHNHEEIEGFSGNVAKVGIKKIIETKWAMESASENPVNFL